MGKKVIDVAIVAKLLEKHAPNELKHLGLPTKYVALKRALEKRFLGQGEYAIAFDLGDGNVFKITVDSADAMSCKAVMDVGGVEGVVGIYDVFKIPGKKFDLFGIVQDKVVSFEDLKKRVSKEAATCFRGMIDLVFNTLHGEFPKFNENVVEDIRKKAEKRWTPVEVDTVVRWAEHLLRTLIELRHYKIFVYDLHVYNAGFRFNGDDLDLILFDLGHRSYKGNQLELRLAANT